MSWTNFHSHCHYCDGKGSPEENILAAIDQGVKMYGFSSHCPVPFENKWSIKPDDLDNYLNEVEMLKAKYIEQIEIYKSLEIDFIPGLISTQSELIQNVQLDYTLGSVHFVGQFADGRHWEIDGTTSFFKKGLQEIYHGDIKKVIGEYYDKIRLMVWEACPHIIGHLDKIKIHNSTEYFFNEQDDWYKDEVCRTLEEIKRSGSIVEVNTRGIYKKLTVEPYPGRLVLEEICKMNIPICLNSDSHQPADITSEFVNTADFLKNIGFKTLRVLKNSEWINVDFDRNGLKF